MAISNGDFSAKNRKPVTILILTVLARKNRMVTNLYRLCWMSQEVKGRIFEPRKITPVPGTSCTQNYSPVPRTGYVKFTRGTQNPAL